MTVGSSPHQLTAVHGMLGDPPNDLIPVTPNDSTLLTDNGEAYEAQAFICKTTAGNIVFVTKRGYTRTYPIALNETIIVRATKVLATGTTAAGIWAFPDFT